MSRAEIFLSIVEGFKLGSLGVSKKPKITLDTDELSVPVTSQKRVGVVDFKPATSLAWTWREPLTNEWKKLFGSKITAPGRLYVMLVARAIPRLGIYFEDVGGEKRTLIGQYDQKHLRFNSEEDQKEWKDLIRDEVDASGLLGIHFPEYWRKVDDTSI
jgi:hypothetical protein